MLPSDLQAAAEPPSVLLVICFTAMMRSGRNNGQPEKSQFFGGVELTVRVVVVGVWGGAGKSQPKG